MHNSSKMAAISMQIGNPAASFQATEPAVVARTLALDGARLLDLDGARLLDLGCGRAWFPRRRNFLWLRQSILLPLRNDGPIPPPLSARSGASAGSK